MNDYSQILIARLLTHQTLRRDEKLVKRVLSDELFRAEVDARLLAYGLKLLDNVYADHVTLALTRTIEPKIFGARDVWKTIILAWPAMAWPCWWCCGRRSSCPSANARKPTSMRTMTRTICSAPKSRCRARKIPRSAFPTRRCCRTSATSWARRRAWT